MIKTRYSTLRASYDCAMAEQRIDGKTVIITGASNGIGKEAARQLLKAGARVILACRDAGKGESARLEICQDTKNWNAVFKHLDLSSLESVRKFANDINTSESRVDILVNNAGVFVPDRRTTQDGFELHFGVNHLGHFLLTYLLLDKLCQSRPSRVVTVSSKAHEFSKLDFDDLQVKRNWASLKAYGRSKAANILFTTHLAKLLDGTGVTAHCLHPGIVKTDLARDFNVRLIACFNFFWKCFNGGIMSPDEGARTTLYCCLEPKLGQTSGRYYKNCKEIPAKPHATDSAAAEALWAASCELCNVPVSPSIEQYRTQEPPPSFECGDVLVSSSVVKYRAQLSPSVECDRVIDSVSVQ